MSFFCVLYLLAHCECPVVADVWMSPTEITHTVVWDASMGIENTQGAEVRALVKKACKVSLSTDMSKFVLAEIKNDPKLVYHIGMTPSKVGSLLPAFSSLIHVLSESFLVGTASRPRGEQPAHCY